MYDMKIIPSSQFICTLTKHLWMAELGLCVAIWRSQSEVGNIDCEIQLEKGIHFFCFLLFCESFNCYNFGTTGPIQVEFSANCTSPNKEFN